MTSLSKFKPGRRVYPIDKDDPYWHPSRKMVVARITKKGRVLCALDNGETRMYKLCDLNVFPED